jgi:glucosamine-6-phosphate deaminase
VEYRGEGEEKDESEARREGMEMAKIDLINTIKGSLLEDFYPKGWDLKKIDRCCEMGMKKVTTAGKWWNEEFLPRAVADVAEMDRRMGDEIADQIESTRREGRKLAIILPVGPMGMYKIVVERLKAIRSRCVHVTTFNMDDWADKAGNTLPGDQPGGLEHAMVQALF